MPDSDPVTTQYLSPDAFSALSGLSPSTVERYRRRGILPYIQPAGPRGRVLIPTTALDDMAGRNPHPPPPHHFSTTPTKKSGPLPKWQRASVEV